MTTVIDYATNRKLDFRQKDFGDTSGASLTIDLFRGIQAVPLPTPEESAYAISTSTYPIVVQEGTSWFNELSSTTYVDELLYSAINKSLVDLQNLPQNILDGLIPATPINDKTIQNAKIFLRYLHQLSLTTLFKWKVPHVGTDGDGGVTFEWWQNKKVLTIFVNPLGDIGYLQAWGPHIWNEMEEGENPSDTNLANLWEWLFN